MAPSYLHNHKEFPDLIKIVGDEKGILPGLVEKDYWIMHALHSLKHQGFNFELKGGTSLSKGHKIIHRFSEDIDIHIAPPFELEVNENSEKDNAVESRKKFYDWLAEKIKIDGITSVSRDHAFDDERYYRSGGIRLNYKTHAGSIPGLKEGILLEAGFDTVTPNINCLISSWAFDKASTISGLKFLDNRAVDIPCYLPGYTLVEKLQTITRKFRQEQEGKGKELNYMRQYYDLGCLLGVKEVQEFVGTDEYKAHKQKRFSKTDLSIPISQNEAFKLADTELRKDFISRYKKTEALYFNGQPDFEEVLAIIKKNLDKL